MWFSGSLVLSQAFPILLKLLAYFLSIKIDFFLILIFDSSVGSTLDWYSEGPGFKSRRLQMNFQLEEGCRRDSKQYAIKYGCIASN